MERLMHLESDSDTKKLIIFDLFLMFFLIGTGITFSILNEFVDEQTVQEMTLTLTEASLIVGFFIGLTSIYYLYKFYKKLAKKKK